MSLEYWGNSYGVCKKLILTLKPEFAHRRNRHDVDRGMGCPAAEGNALQLPL